MIKEHKRELFNIAEDLQQDKTIRVGAYLLLDNQIAAEKLFNELDIDVKQEFQMYPIFRFWMEDD